MSIGTARVTSLAYVDDMLDVNVSPENAEFSHKNKSDYSVGKYSVMTVNQYFNIKIGGMILKVWEKNITFL